MQACVPNEMTWATRRTVTQTLNPIVQQCVLNQTRGFLLHSDPHAATFRMSIELQEVHEQRLGVVHPRQVEDFESKISVLKKRMAKAVVDVIKPFLQFSQKFVVDQAHNMLSLMLDPQFKGFECVIDYVGVAKAKQVMEEYDKKVPILYLLKVYKFLNSSGS